MKRILISSYSMDVGGVERSLINMLENFDYTQYNVDLMLYRKRGEFLSFIPEQVRLMEEMDGYNCFGVPILQLIKEKRYNFALARILAKSLAKGLQVYKNIDEVSYFQVQLMRKFSLPLLSNLKEEYDVAISYYWPHYFVSDKVKAKKKIAWIHTDYSTIYTNVNIDLKMWRKFDHIIAISEEARKAFLKKYPELDGKVRVMENITSPEFITKLSNEYIEEEILFGNNINILTIARFSHAKGIDLAVKAMDILQRKGFNNIKWFVIGFGGDKERIKSLIKQFNLEDKFILLGKKINPYPYIKHCDIYIQPSRYEGKSVTVTEAQILGKPVLVTNYPTAPSQVRDGIDGIITALGPEGIADGVQRLVLNKRLVTELKRNTISHDYSNKYELKKLYELIE